MFVSFKLLVKLVRDRQFKMNLFLSTLLYSRRGLLKQKSLGFSNFVENSRNLFFYLNLEKSKGGNLSIDGTGLGSS